MLPRFPSSLVGSEARRVRLLYCVGWLLPVFTTAPYTVFRLQRGDTACWMELDTTTSWLAGAPILVILALNVGTLVSVVVVLRSKGLYLNMAVASS